ncbi:RNA editing complex protein [Trypanosoma grayi]|uniref:RNA editing complex protein n=1 Tax=Trypanosoma grayi TaxID=71804 RepID=UPI0004F3F393|nr:RNA editing complex protein [Trypanosoma grayi]KEG13120.1 RNA editing complex protein [Trypanosoma grayi]
MLWLTRVVRQRVAQVAEAQLKKTCSNSSGGWATHGDMDRNGIPVPQFAARDFDEFFFSSSDAKECRLCGGVTMRGSAHAGLPLHQTLETIMWLLLQRAKKHASGAVGVSPEAARSFFLDELRRSEQALRGGGCSCSEDSSRRRSFTSHPEVSDECDKVLSDQHGVSTKIPCSVATESFWGHVVGLRASRLRDKLHVLTQLGVLGLAAPRGGGADSHGFQRDAGFQRLECIGDHNWGHTICHRLLLLFPEVDWRTPPNISAIDAFRTVLESNQHLDAVYTALRLDDIVRSTEAKAARSTKFKADVVEAIAGELHVALWSLQPYDTDGITARPSIHGIPFTPPLASIVQNCLHELYDLVVLCFIAKYNAPLVRAVVELSRRDQYMMDSSSSFYALRRTRRRRFSNGSTRWTLPSSPPLDGGPQQRQYRPVDAGMHTSPPWTAVSYAALLDSEEGSSTAVDSKLHEAKMRAVGAAACQTTRVAVWELTERCGFLRQSSRL